MESTLNGWVKRTFTEIELSDEPWTRTVLKRGAPIRITHTPKKVNVELTLGLLSTDNLADWTRIVFHLAPAGIIVDAIDEEFYRDRLLLLRSRLTGMLLDAHSQPMAEKYLGILERRDRERWGKPTKETTVDLKKNDKEDIHLTFTIKE